MTKEELRDEFLECIKSAKHSDQWAELLTNMCGSDAYVEDYLKLHKEIVQNGFTIKVEEGKGGEGEGDSCWGVFSVTKGTETVTLKANAYYSSYVGTKFYGDSKFKLDIVEKVKVERYEWQ